MPLSINITDQEAALVLAIRNYISASGPGIPPTPPTPLPQPAAAPAPVEKSLFNPAWKTVSSGGRQFTQAGVNEIDRLFRQGLSDKEIAKIMNIGMGSAGTYRARHEGTQTWGRFKPQPQD